MAQSMWSRAVRLNAGLAASANARGSCSTALDRQSATQLSHDAPPECGRLPDSRISRLFLDRRVHHDEAAGRIDVDRLATDAAEREHPSLARQYPDLIAVADRYRAAAGLGAHAWPSSIHAAGMSCRPRQFPS